VAGLQNLNARETETEWFAEADVDFKRETESLISQNLIVSGPLPVEIVGMIWQKTAQLLKSEKNI